MPLPNTNLTMGAVYWEIFRANTPANLTLEHLVLNSRLSNKSKPFNLGDFRNYDGNPTVTMSVLTADDANYRYVNVNFRKSFDTKFTTNVFYTINKQDGYAPQQQSINMLGNDTVVAVDFQADRRNSDYTVSVSLNYCNHAYSTATTLNVTVPAKAYTPPPETTAQRLGREDATYDNVYNPTYGVARPQNYGYWQGSQEYNEYMNSYNMHRMMQA